MNEFDGLRVRIYCTTHDCGVARIDRVFVKGMFTLFGEAQFQVMGQKGEAGLAEPVTKPTADFRKAWAEKQALEKEIAAARVGQSAAGKPVQQRRSRRCKSQQKK